MWDGGELELPYGNLSSYALPLPALYVNCFHVVGKHICRYSKIPSRREAKKECISKRLAVLPHETPYSFKISNFVNWSLHSFHGPSRWWELFGLAGRVALFVKFVLERKQHSWMIFLICDKNKWLLVSNK